jgi:hypothetical protein
MSLSSANPVPLVSLKPDEVMALVRIHAEKRLRLAFSVGLAGQVQLNGDPIAPVTELLRLALIGARAEATELIDPGESVAEAVRKARIAWKLL